jgi:hypothetical protein
LNAALAKASGGWWAIGFDWNVDMNIHEMIIDAKARYALQFIMDIIISGC